MKLFLRIFVCFWLATLLMIGSVLGVSEFLPVTFPGDKGFEPESAKAALATAVNAYEMQGAGALYSTLQEGSSTRHKRIYLFDQNGKVLYGDNPPLFYGGLARGILQTGHSEMQRYFGLRVLFVCPVQSNTGRRYAAVMTAFEPGKRLARLRFWFNFAIAMLPAGLVCMALSLYITRPITKLRTTAQRLAGGDLNARSSLHKITRRDELGDLRRDFDMMADRIQLLMTAQRRFVADVSHELGAPLTRMHLALALLRRRLTDKNFGELERIEHETEKLSNLVQQLLLLASLEAGSGPAESLAPVSLEMLRASIIEDANFEASYSGCTVTGTRADVTFLAYPQLLRRAIDNVLRNSIRHSPRGTQIQFNSGIDAEMQHLVVEISDCGPGVPENMLSDIFLPFVRTAPGRERNTGGIGLGLSIAAEAIRAHDGTIVAANRTGGGLQVIIKLPLRAPEPEQELQHATEELSANG
jgi:two-component system sensor histidine kinase CpxA